MMRVYAGNYGYQVAPEYPEDNRLPTTICPTEKDALIEYINLWYEKNAKIESEEDNGK